MMVYKAQQFYQNNFNPLDVGHASQLMLWKMGQI
jgi:hypothetical protein